MGTASMIQDSPFPDVSAQPTLEDDEDDEEPVVPVYANPTRRNHPSPNKASMEVEQTIYKQLPMLTHPCAVQVDEPSSTQITTLSSSISVQPHSIPAVEEASQALESPIPNNTVRSACSYS